MRSYRELGERIEGVGDLAQRTEAFVDLLWKGLSETGVSWVGFYHFEGGDELVDPIRSHYKEFFIVVNALLDGEEVTTCPFIWVDQDFALPRGWIQGFPKKLGSIWMTRTFGVGGPADPGLRPGGRHGATCSARGRAVASEQGTLRTPLTDREALLSRVDIYARGGSNSGGTSCVDSVRDQRNFYLDDGSGRWLRARLLTSTPAASVW